MRRWFAPLRPRSRAVPAALRRAAVGLAMAAAVAAVSPVARAAGYAIAFGGTGSGDVDRVKIRIDDPATVQPGPPVDVGAADFTIEFWIKAQAADNTAPAVTCGANVAGSTATSSSTATASTRTASSASRSPAAASCSACPATAPATARSAARRTSSTTMAPRRRAAAAQRRLPVDLRRRRARRAGADGPDGDVSYPDDGVPGTSAAARAPTATRSSCSARRSTTPAPAFPSYRGLLDEMRISSALRYATRVRAAARAVRRGRRHGRAASTSTKAPAATPTTPAGGAGAAHGDIRRAARGDGRRRGPPTARSTSAALVDNGTVRLDDRRERASPIRWTSSPHPATRRACSSSSSPGASASCATGCVTPHAVPRPRGKTAGGGERGLLRPRVPSGLRGQRPLLRLLHARRATAR